MKTEITETKHFTVGERIPFRSITPKRTRFYGSKYAHIYSVKKRGEDKGTRYAIEIHGEEYEEYQEVYSLSIVSATVREIKSTWLGSLYNYPLAKPEHDVTICIVLENVVFKDETLSKIEDKKEYQIKCKTAQQKREGARELFFNEKGDIKKPLAHGKIDNIKKLHEDFTIINASFEGVLFSWVERKKVLFSIGDIVDIHRGFFNGKSKIFMSSGYTEAIKLVGIQYKITKK